MCSTHRLSPSEIPMDDEPISNSGKGRRMLDRGCPNQTTTGREWAAVHNLAAPRCFAQDRHVALSGTRAAGPGQDSVGRGWRRGGGQSTASSASRRHHEQDRCAWSKLLVPGWRVNSLPDPGADPRLNYFAPQAYPGVTVCPIRAATTLAGVLHPWHL